MPHPPSCSPRSCHEGSQAIFTVCLCNASVTMRGVNPIVRPLSAQAAYRRRHAGAKPAAEVSGLWNNRRYLPIGAGKLHQPA